MKNNIIIYQESDLRARIHIRKGEHKLGEKILVMKPGEGLANLIQYVTRGIKYVLLGIPESVGPMANYGKCCTDHAWSAFLNAFLNMQSNRFLGGDSILCLGHIDTRAINTEAGLLEKIDRTESIAYTAFDSMADFTDGLKQVLRFFKGYRQPVGIELDMDSIVNMPSSAMTPSGFTVEEARKLMRVMATNLKSAYVHLSEGAPSNNSDEMIKVGKTLAYLVADFIRFNSGGINQ